jgi:hypothetical protein
METPGSQVAKTTSSNGRNGEAQAQQRDEAAVDDGASEVSLTSEQQLALEVAKIRQAVIADQLANDPIIPYVEELVKNTVVMDPLQHEVICGTPA